MAMRELAAARSFWLLLLVVGPLVGQALVDSVNLYAEASGAGGGPAALSQGLRPLEGFVVPTWGVYDLVATFLLPFVVIRVFSADKQSGAQSLLLQAPVGLFRATAAKAVVLAGAWLLSMTAGAIALVYWSALGGHLSAPETSTVVLGHLLRGLVAIGISATAASVLGSAASAAIVALTITIGTWALEYVAAASGGWTAMVAAYTPSSALRVFEHGELRAATVLMLVIVAATGLTVAGVWLDERRTVRARVARGLVVVSGAVVACVAGAHIRVSRDVSEDRRNSFAPADERALRAIATPLRVTAYLAADDPRRTELDRGVLAKLRRTMRDVHVEYAATGRSGLFERPGDHYGEVWYALGGRSAMSRSTGEEIVLETIYELAGVTPPAAAEAGIAGFPLRARPTGAGWVFFGMWPVLVAAGSLAARRPWIRR